MQPLAQMRVMIARLPGEPRGRRPVLERGVFRLRALRARDHRLRELPVVEQGADALLLADQERIKLRHAVDTDAGRADERERGKTRGIAHRELRGNPAPERAADEMHAPQVERFEEIEIEIRQIGDGVEPCRRVGFAEPGMLGHDHVELLREPRHGGKPDARAPAAMQEQERCSRAAAHETDAAIPNHDRLVGVVGHALPVPPCDAPAARQFYPSNAADIYTNLPQSIAGVASSARDAVAARAHAPGGDVMYAPTGVKTDKDYPIPDRMKAWV